MAKAIEFEIKIKGDSGVFKTLSIEATNADEAIGRIVESATHAGESIRRMAEQSLVFDTAIRAIQDLNGLVNGLVAPFNSFETAMRKANTMALESKEGYKHLSDQIVELSRNVPLLREEIAEGLYQVISNGVPKDNWISFLEDSSRAAVGGVADLGQTVTVTSTLIKNYGLEWSAAGAIQDRIQTTAKNGVTSFEQLGQALPRVSGSASQLGVSMDELMAVFATATGVTGNTSEVSTQLAAVLNSLIKPSSEASRAASAMWIQFDAASVKACGGFRNFLAELDSSVGAYSQSSGQLSETIYGQLFGSAEALRLLGSLTGEQKDRFSENIGAMSESAGAIEQAFGQMASTGDSLSVILSNQTNACLDWIGALISSKAPMIELLANLGTSLLSMNQVWNMLKSLRASVLMHTAAINATAVAQKAAAIAAGIWSGAQAALNAVLSLNPVGLVVIAIGALVAAVMYAYNNCEGFRQICDELWSSVKELSTAVWAFLVKAFERASKVIRTAWEWVRDFFGITDSSSADKAASSIDRQSDATGSLATANERLAASGLKVRESVSWQKMSYEQLGAAIEAQKAKVAQLAGTNAGNADAEGKKLRQMEARYKALGSRFGLSDKSGANEFDGKRLISNASSYKELGNNIAYYQAALDKTASSETGEIARLSAVIAELQRKQESIRLLQEAYSQPEELNTLSDIERALQYQRSLRSAATAEQLGGIDSEIARLEDLRLAMEENAHIPVATDQIRSYRQLEEEISFYEGKLKSCNVETRAQVQAQLNELRKLKQGWDDSLNDLDAPADISRLNTIRELSDAESYYRERMKRASDDEIIELARQCDAIERKRKAKEAISGIPEVDRLDGLSEGQLRVELKAIGIDGIKEKIRELQALLDDTENPLSTGTGAAAKNALESWKDYLRQAEAMRDASKQAEIYGQTMARIGRTMGALKGVVGDSAASWLDYGANLMNTVATAVPELMKLFAVNQAYSFSEAIKGAAGIPFPASIAAIAANVAAVTVAFAQIPKFANGGIAYGPTLGLFGEYAGASTNPEVVAPLNTLKKLIGPEESGGSVSQRVEWVIDGFKLRAMINKIDRLSSRR